MSTSKLVNAAFVSVIKSGSLSLCSFTFALISLREINFSLATALLSLTICFFMAKAVCWALFAAA